MNEWHSKLLLADSGVLYEDQYLQVICWNGDVALLAVAGPRPLHGCIQAALLLPSSHWIVQGSSFAAHVSPALSMTMLLWLDNDSKGSSQSRQTLQRFSLQTHSSWQRSSSLVWGAACGMMAEAWMLAVRRWV